MLHHDPGLQCLGPQFRAGLNSGIFQNVTDQFTPTETIDAFLHRLVEEYKEKGCLMASFFYLVVVGVIYDVPTRHFLIQFINITIPAHFFVIVV